ncbi:MAG: YbaB/EbfC family nucleoid-associated protein [Legionellaceae bacterium]|nr:YbaB/EbfC family nucleoid-associated protein [Legionellaceae bacterium]
MAIGGNIGENIGDLVKEAQKMQQRMQAAQQELGDLRVEGRSGGDMVMLTLNGRHQILDLKIKPSALDEDPEFLSELIIAAYNDALKKIEEASKRKITNLTEGLNLPTDLMKQMQEEGKKDDDKE